MTLSLLKQALKAKTVEFEEAIKNEKSHQELKNIYKELKELQYQIVLAEINEKEPAGFFNQA
jgi:hypothetical protein